MTPPTRKFCVLLLLESLRTYFSASEIAMLVPCLERAGFYMQHQMRAGFRGRLWELSAYSKLVLAFGPRNGRRSFHTEGTC